MAERQRRSRDGNLAQPYVGLFAQREQELRRALHGLVAGDAGVGGPFPQQGEHLVGQCDLQREPIVGGQVAERPQRGLLDHPGEDVRRRLLRDRVAAVGELLGVPAQLLLERAGDRSFVEAGNELHAARAPEGGIAPW